MYRHTRRGFTLIEIVIVVMIIALIATLMLPNLMSRFFSSQRKIAEAQVEKVKTQVSLYILDNSLGGLPDDFELTDLEPDYLSEADLLDPWGHQFEVINDGSTFYVISYGDGGEPGGEDNFADIESSH